MNQYRANMRSLGFRGIFYRRARLSEALCVTVLMFLFGTHCSFAGLFHSAKNDTKINVQTNTVSSTFQGTTNSMLPGSMDALDDKYALVIGDRLSFSIVEDEEGIKPLVVTDSGDLEVPYIGRFPAVGKTCKELARELKVQLEKEYYYQATVIVAVDSKARSHGRVYLVGQVRGPGPQDIPSDEVFTLSKAVLRAGGFTESADQRHVKVTRKNDAKGAKYQTFIVNVQAILEKGKLDSDMTLQAGDLVFVPERLVLF